jgi:hypothetical protein
VQRKDNAHVIAPNPTIVLHATAQQGTLACVALLEAQHASWQQAGVMVRLMRLMCMHCLYCFMRLDVTDLCQQQCMRN